MSLSAEIFCRIVGIETDTADIATNTRVTKADYFKALSDGDGAGQAQVIWSDKRTITGTDTLQLSALPDTRDGAAVTVNFTAVKALYLRNTSQSVSVTVVVPTGLVSHVVSVQPGGVFLLANPTDAGNSGGIGGAVTHTVQAPSSATYEIVIVGEGSII